MNLYDILTRIDHDRNIEDTWDIIHMFESYIQRECYNSVDRRFDEDMYSDIVASLPNRIMNFKIREK